MSRAAGTMAFETLLACADRDSLPESPPNYPPMAAWPELRGSGKIISAWRRSLRSDGGRRPVVYVHVPFCETLCTFCGFYKLPAAPGAIDRYLDALEKEIKLLGPLFKGRPLRFLCIGGGTPSLLSIAQLDRLFKMLRAHFRVAPGTRIAFEASPNTLDPEKLAYLKSAGVEWLAVGVQSFDPALLKRLNRRQDPAQTVAAIRQAKKAGIKQVEVDLMTGLPGQTEKSFLKDVRTAARLDVERVYLFDFQPKCHTSAGALGGSLAGRELEDARAWRRRGMDILTAKGYKMCCGHWVSKRKGDCWPYSYDQGEEGSYSVLGLGPGAVSYAMNAARYRNAPDEAAYERGLKRGVLPSGTGVLLSARDEMANFVLLDAMQRGQVNGKNFRRRFGKGPASVFGAELGPLLESGLLSDSAGTLIISDREHATRELRRALYSRDVIERLSKVYGPLRTALPGRREISGPAFNRRAEGTFECSLQAGALESLLYGAPAGPALPGRSAALELLRAAAGKKEALLLSAACEPGALELSAAHCAGRAGFKKVSAFFRLPREAGFFARLKAAGVSRLLFPLGVAVTAAELAGVRAAVTAGLTVAGVYVPSGAGVAGAETAIKKVSAAGAGEFIVSFPEGRDRIGASYKSLRPLVRSAGKYNTRFLRVPLCALGPARGRSLDSLNKGSGDARESGGSAGAVKPKLCLHCRFLLSCPGPARGYAEKFGLKEFRTVK
ncbi:MAG: coproporphyrinogen-III oxidase family protein [Elusimicrobiota bacterium]